MSQGQTGSNDPRHAPQLIQSALQKLRRKAPVPDDELAALRSAVASALENLHGRAGLSDQQFKIFAFIVTNYIEGMIGNLAAAVIVADVLKKSITPEHEVHVRVTVRNIRERLQSYYRTKGERDTIRITIPKERDPVHQSHYVPVIAYREALDSEAESLLKDAFAALDAFTIPAFERSLLLLDKALLKHPGHPRVLARMADVHVYEAHFGLYPRAELEKAEQLVAESLARSEGFWESHLVDGCVKGLLHWDWPGAGKAFTRAIELHGDEVAQDPWHVIHLVVTGNVKEALPLMEAYTERNHRVPQARADLALVQMLTGNLAAAERTLDAAIEAQPHHFSAYAYQTMVYEAKGDLEAAYAVFNKAPIDLGEIPYMCGWPGYFDAMANRRAKADMQLKAIQAARAGGHSGYIPAHQVALILIGLDRLDEAIVAVREAVDDRDPNMKILPLLPFLRRLHSLPEFWKLVGRLNLTEWTEAKVTALFRQA
jgi:tetratricopeptide (TPR) repeat protein